MKRIIYLCVCTIGLAGLFTSCINQVEPTGLQTLREGKAAYYQALANLQTAQADKIEAEAAYTQAMATADAAYQTAQASLIQAQANYWDAQTTLLKAKVAAQEEETRHDVEMNKLAEAIEAARAAYEEAYYANQTSEETKELALKLDSLEKAQAALEKEAEEDSIQHEINMQALQKTMDEAAITAQTALNNAQAGLVASQAALATAQENLRTTLANIEAQQGLLTTNQQTLLDNTLTAYQNAAQAYNQAQQDLIDAKASLVAMAERYRIDSIDSINGQQTLIAKYQEEINARQSDIDEYNAEIAALETSKADNEMFNGLPVDEWMDKLNELRAKDTVYYSQMGNLEAELTTAKYETMADDLDYADAYENHDLLSWGVWRIGGGDFNFFLDSLALYNEVENYLVDRTVPIAYGKAQYADNRAQRDTSDLGHVYREIVSEIADAQADTAAKGAALRAAEAAVQTATQDSLQALADTLATWRSDPNAVMGKKQIDMKEYFGNDVSSSWGGYPSGNAVVAKFMAVMEDAAVSSPWVLSTNNLLYPMPNSDNPAIGYYGTTYYPYVGISSQAFFQVNTTPDRIDWVFNGGDYVTRDDETQTVTRGILGVLDYIEQYHVYQQFADNDADLQAAKLAWGLTFTLDSIKYAADLTAASTQVATDETNIKNALISLKGDTLSVTPTTDELDAYNDALMGIADSARAAYIAASDQYIADTVALHAATSTYNSSVADYQIWKNSGWDSLFTSIWNADGMNGGSSSFAVEANAVDGVQYSEVKVGSNFNAFFDAIKLYTGANDFYLNNGDPERVAGRSPKAWNELRAWIAAQYTADTSYVAHPTPTPHYTSAADAIASTSRPSIFLDGTVSGSGTDWYIEWAPYANAATDYDAAITFCTSTSGEGYMLATADDNFWENQLLGYYEDVKDSISDVVDADLVALAAKKASFETAIANVNAKINQYNGYLDAYNGAAGTDTIIVADAYDNTKYGSFQNAIKALAYDPAVRTDYQWSFNGEASWVTKQAIIEHVFGTATVTGVPDAEYYYVCLNNQVGNTTTGTTTIGDEPSGVYGADNGYANYTDTIPSIYVSYQYMDSVEFNHSCYIHNRGFDSEYPFFLGDNREHGLRLQNYNADFNTIVDPSDGRFIMLHPNFSDAVYYKLIYDQTVIDALTGDIDDWVQNLSAFRTAIEQMKKDFENDTTTFKNAAIKAITDQNFTANAIAALNAAQDAYDAAVATLGNPDDELPGDANLSAADYNTAQQGYSPNPYSWWAYYNYFAPLYQAALAKQATTGAELATEEEAAAKIGADLRVKWLATVNPLYLEYWDVQKASYQVEQLIDVYWTNYSVAAAKGTDGYTYPVFDSADGTTTTDNLDVQSNDLGDLYDKVMTYYDDAEAYYNGLIDDAEDEISGYTESLNAVQGQYDEDVYVRALEGYYDAAQLAIKAQETVVANKETAVETCEIRYSYWKTQLDTLLETLGKAISSTGESE
ncbi:MAG: hypothetical protein LKK19_04535 [Bacteroidales bacterium]|jgi:hypothetical protein|nr:hypothetical protein [Bacteroidales bacterium]MCI2121949.1 hypothetical protein [Bacteroidales bacterium]MCI2144986.1 hypothetical protein [Bacteroidales bacterium]